MQYVLRLLRNWCNRFLDQPTFLPTPLTGSSTANDVQFEKLTILVNELDALYIKTPTGLQPTPQEIELSKAFCVRFHACLEDYFEQIGINMLALAKNKIDTGFSLIQQI